MIAVDTNVLVRLLVEDDDEQCKKVILLLSDLQVKNEQAFVPSLVILELVWVLAVGYKIKRLDVIENVLKLFKLPVFKIEHSGSLKETLVTAKQNSYDIADLMIAGRCALEQALPVMTFDKKASKLDVFTLLD